MPLLTRFYLKSAFLYLAASLLLGVFQALPSAYTPSFLSALTPVYFHLFLVGWVTQMIFGVIYWMFPIITRENPRGNERVAWATYLLLNGGLLLRMVAEPLNSYRTQIGNWVGWLLVLSALAQWVAAVLFVWQAWPRVKERFRGQGRRRRATT